MTTCGRTRRISATRRSTVSPSAWAAEARVAVAEQAGLGVADDLCGSVELAATVPGNVFPYIGGVHDRVEDVAFLATGAGHENRVNTCGVILRYGPGTFGGLVVGMRVHGQDAELVVHGWPR